MVSKTIKKNQKVISNEKVISNHLSYDTDYAINDIVKILRDLKSDKNIRKISTKKVTWSNFTLIYII